jgi:hypothetical protein
MTETLILRKIAAQDWLKELEDKYDWVASTRIGKILELERRLALQQRHTETKLEKERLTNILHR